MADNTVRGRFVWHELITPNAAGAQEFYARTVGWKSQAWEQDPNYRMFAAPNGPIGGMIELRDGMPLWVPYVGVTDVDAAVEQATRLGATVATPATVLPNGGRYAVLVDPHGGTFGVHAGGEMPPEAPTGYGEFQWHELATTADPVEAFGFYNELFGWEELGRHDMGPIGIYLLFGRNGEQKGGMFKKGDMGKPGPAYWVCYVRVKDVDDVVATVKAARGTLLNGPMEVPGGDRIAQLADPHGAFFAVHMTVADVQGAKPAPKRETAATGAPRTKTAKSTAKKTATKSAEKSTKPTPKKSIKPAAKKTKKKTKKKAVKLASKKPQKKAKKQAAKPVKKKAKGAGKKAKRAAKKARRPSKKAVKARGKKAKKRR